MSDDALIERGAECETLLQRISLEVRDLQTEISVARRGLGKPAGKLAANLGIGGLGLALAPPTLGWSLLLTIGSTVMLVWDGVDMGADYSRYRAVRGRLLELRRDASDLADELAEIHAVLEERRYPRSVSTAPATGGAGGIVGLGKPAGKLGVNLALSVVWAWRWRRPPWAGLFS